MQDVEPEKHAKNDGASSASLEELRRENALLKQKIVKLERLASRDTLTPLFNRRHFLEVLERWSWRAERYGGDYGIIFIDVDELKAVNDGMGHVIGDKVLIAIANVLVDNIRRSDVAARLGGDEFGILLDSTNDDEVLAKVEELRSEVSKLQIDVDGDIVNPTISLGHSMIEAGKTADDVMEKVDRRMYREKRAGKSPAP